MTYDPKKSTNDVRQGSGRMANLRVLIWSLGGVVVLFALIYYFFFVLGPQQPPV